MLLFLTFISSGYFPSATGCFPKGGGCTTFSWFLLFGVHASKKTYLSWTPPLLEKDNSNVNPGKNTENLSAHSIRKTNKKNGCITGDASSTNYY